MGRDNSLNNHILAQGASREQERGVLELEK
jgi:hypothetical protein